MAVSARTEAGVRLPAGTFAPFAGVSSPSLRAAGQEVVEGWLAADVDGARTAEVLDEVQALVGALDTGEPPPPATDPARRALRRRLLPPVQAAVQRAWVRASPPPPADEMLRALAMLNGLHSSSYTGWEDGAVLAATAPEGLELVMEVAHDLRSPLTSILFLSETLRRGQSGDVSELQRRQLGLIYSAALGMVSMASDLTELAQGGDRLLEPTPAPLSVSEVFESVCDIVRPMAEEKHIALRVLPPPSDQRIGHSAALSRVLLNLVTNALRYTEDGFVEITTRARAPAYLEFSVRDSGPGIDPEAQAVLYEPFRRRGAGDRYGFSGSGLGLAISRRLVHAMGAELDYETAPGWGTRFFFELELPVAGM
jgi:signal transduction histidine kinase